MAMARLPGRPPPAGPAIHHPRRLRRPRAGGRVGGTACPLLGPWGGREERLMGPPDLVPWRRRRGQAASGHTAGLVVAALRATESLRLCPAGSGMGDPAWPCVRGPGSSVTPLLCCPPQVGPWRPPRSWTDKTREPGVLAAEATSQQERFQAIAEKRKRQAEVESKRRQLEDERRQLQHLKSKALRERWLLEGTPSSASEGDEDMRRQMQEDEQKARLLEGSISRLEKEIEVLENGDAIPTTPKKNAVTPSPAPAPAPSPAKEEQKARVVLNSQQTPVGTPKETRVSNTPVRTPEGATRMKAAMYSVEITVEKDRATGATRVLSSTTLLPQQPPQGVKVYEDETKVVHAVDGALENGIHPLSASEVDELIHKADEVTLGEAGAADSRGPAGEAPRTSPLRREITGVQAEPGEATAGPPGVQPGQEPPVTMTFMGYRDVEDEAETKKVLGLQDTITAELVVIEDAAEAKEPAPPNGSAPEPPAAPGSEEEAQAGPEPPTSDPQDLDMKKHRCKCCSVM
ncbi:paralemmin-1 isoform X2 [Choloepus didactylus]|uniref:paralemmin-1 isoform X2 n=1 Tax=Choloepus didactylus TaxID=27675 RepID=UPI00189D845F|nr:paralemmin-1 isoform X2 [Choloepus didactylus]